ncbi:uncharacterized protein TRAVEDRAFT_49822 [Trametes versicolor FP-101664 SS1]|uniref:uncharacterized protein n=1 Tax=Trametes versicolor (strain FP-101664) TaxID=717944 RepID=UPI00046240AA|nr:uncharacterized protein TRAVEDRAFT_49822 [Trametes versicolor FP-101664 SS1]EIW57013.1 hypothetical protein TRAVEDRAFT_49822 [Trametes versicolor FP-101664 SS1]
MLAFFGHLGQEPHEFFKTYSAEFKPKKKNGGADSGVGKAAGTHASGRGKGAVSAVKSTGDEEYVEM